MIFGKQRGDVCGKKIVYYNLFVIDMFITIAKVTMLHTYTDLMTKTKYHTKKKVQNGSVKTNFYYPSRIVLKVNLESNSVGLTYFKLYNHP